MASIILQKKNSSEIKVLRTFTGSNTHQSIKKSIEQCCTHGERPAMYLR